MGNPSAIIGHRGVKTLLDGMAELLWPARCAGCDLPGTLLCEDCAKSIPRIDPSHACPRCGAPFGLLVCTECTRCRERGEDGGGLPAAVAAVAGAGPLPGRAPDLWDQLDGVCCYGVLAHPLDACIRIYKDEGERRLVPLLTGFLLEALEGQRAFDLGLLDGVTFVPATPRAYARRGFDHMGGIAQGVAEGLGLPLLDVLARGARADQRALARSARLENAESDSVAICQLPGRRLLLLDDVLTTGATLSGAAHALRVAGAASVFGACIARAWM